MTNRYLIPPPQNTKMRQFLLPPHYRKSNRTEVDKMWVEYDDLKYKRVVCATKEKRAQAMRAIKVKVAASEKRFFEGGG